MLEYQKNGRYFAQAPRELLDLAGEELRRLGARSLRPVHRGIHFETDSEGLYRTVYCARFVTRVLAPLLRFRCHAARYLYRRAREIDWAELLSAEDTFAVFASVANSRIRHSQYAALKLKDAIVDTIRDRFGKRPDVDRKDPDQGFGLHIENDVATISLDVSGGSLHRRGYRVQSVEAPMQETLAAAVIRLSGWDGARPLYDPMCGSGTLLCEALSAYCRVPSGYLRQRFGFMGLPDFEPDRWRALRSREDRDIRPLPPRLIGGSDFSDKAVRAARANAQRLPGGGEASVKLMDFHDIPDLQDTTIVCNPPYGVRLGHTKEIPGLYREFGDFLKQRCRGASAFVYFGRPELIPTIRLHPAWKKPLKNGGLDGRLVRFDLY
ncbi:MAG: THUMP domain-containing protein [Desulfobacteraceae bacterium]|jgi:putative N6-adenine-specific DNA methylase